MLSRHADLLDCFGSGFFATSPPGPLPSGGLHRNSLHSNLEQAPSTSFLQFADEAASRKRTSAGKASSSSRPTSFHSTAAAQPQQAIGTTTASSSSRRPRMKANPTSFLRFPETFPSANMPPEAAARKWAVIAADAQQQASQLAAEQQTLEQMSSANMAKLQTLNQTAQTAAEASQRAAAASVAKDLGMSVSATPTSVATG